MAPPVIVFHFFVLSRGGRHFSGSDGINGQDPNTTSIILFGSYCRGQRDPS